jgi:SAM-dependent methyltransferase
VSIEYDHCGPGHTLTGARAALPRIFRDSTPRTLLDVGCGIGTWLRAAADAGVEEVYGVDGVDIPAQRLLVPRTRFRVVDLSKPWDLGRRFEAALCLEVAEHLDESVAPMLVASLARHADEIIFSAACPGQPGQHHVNCQWPEYWQHLFNANGFQCSDEVRWAIWNDRDVEVWYRQNMFVATRNPSSAGTEERLRAVIHPEFLPDFVRGGADDAIATARNRATAMTLDDVENGKMPLRWYAAATQKALASKVRRRLAANH